VIAYEVYIYSGALTDPQDVGLLTLVGTTSGLSQLIVFPYRATWNAGVRVAARGRRGEPELLDHRVERRDSGRGGGRPFRLQPLGTARKPVDLRDSGT